MYKGYKTEIDPTPKQIKKIDKTIAACRFLQNLYIEKRNEYWKEHKEFLNVNPFDQWYRKEHIPNNPQLEWILSVSSKSRKQALNDVNDAYKNYYAGRAEKPKFKKKKRNQGSMYFVREGKRQPIKCQRHRIQIPTLGYVKLKEKGYIPTDKPLISGRITKKAGRYYVSVLVDKEKKSDIYQKPSEYGIGIDLGIQSLAICSDGTTYKNINKTNKIGRLEKQLRKQQRNLSRKILKNKEVKPATYKNIDKTTLKIQKIYQRLNYIRENYENQVVNDILNKRPQYITLEKLNIKGMMSNKYLSKSIQTQRWHSLKSKLINKATLMGIEVREVSSFYPSSKTCSGCGHVNHQLKLSDRQYRCRECELDLDRDMNAAINLKNAVEYIVL